MTFCNAVPPGLVAGVFHYETGAFYWVPLPEPLQRVRGATGIGFWQGHYWIILQDPRRCRLLELRADLEPIQDWPLRATDPHSILCLEDSFLISDSGCNGLWRILWKGRQPAEALFWQYDRACADRVHLNSAAFHEGSLYVSCFGQRTDTGWNSAQDGFVYHVQGLKILVDGLYHPHSLLSFEGALWWLESKRGRLHTFSNEEGHRAFLELKGYIRGLAISDRWIYVAASAARRRSRSLGQWTQDVPKEPELCDSWLYRIDRKTLQWTRRNLSYYGAELFDLHILATQETLPLEKNPSDPVRERIRRLEEECLQSPPTRKKKIRQWLSFLSPHRSRG